MRKQLGLLSTRQQQHTAESIEDRVSDIWKMFPTRGSETIRKELLMRYGMRVSRYVIRIY